MGRKGKQPAGAGRDLSGKTFGSSRVAKRSVHAPTTICTSGRSRKIEISAVVSEGPESGFPCRHCLHDERKCAGSEVRPAPVPRGAAGIRLPSCRLIRHTYWLSRCEHREALCDPSPPQRRGRLYQSSSAASRQVSRVLLAERSGLQSRGRAHATALDREIRRWVPPSWTDGCPAPASH
jgi:hypothetical protein